MIASGVWELPSDIISLDSTLTIATPKCHEIIRVAAKHWRRMTDQLRKCWRNRATKLNIRPIPGRFDRVPDDIEDSIHDDICASLTLDWENITKQFKSCMVRIPNSSAKRKSTYVFGKERVLLQNQVHRTFYLNSLLKLALFGRNFSRVSGCNEIVHMTKRLAVVHFASRRRLNEVFNINGLSAVVHLKNDLEYTCCGKVSVRKNNRETI